MIFLPLSHMILPSWQTWLGMSLSARNAYRSVTDIVMPGVSGPDLFRSLADQDPALRVVYMSGYTEEAIERQAELDHGRPFVLKPFTAAALVAGSGYHPRASAFGFRFSFVRGSRPVSGRCWSR